MDQIKYYQTRWVHEDNDLVARHSQIWGSAYRFCNCLVLFQ